MSLLKISILANTKYFDANHREELIQRSAWRLVRAASDLHGDNKGEKKMQWCIARIQRDFPELGDKAEEYIRAAYSNFKLERST